MRLRLAVSPTRITPIALRLNSLHRQGAEAKRITKLACCFFEIDNPFRIWNLMNSVHAGHILRLDPGSDAFVRGQHELFDQTMRPSSLRPHDGFHVSVWIELNHWFRKIEIDRSAAMPFRVQLQRQLIHPFELWHQLRELLPRLDIPVEDALDLRVRHSLRAADDAFADLVSKHFATSVYLPAEAHHSPVLLSPP